MHLQNHIDGRWVDATGGDTFDNTDPANGELIATVTKSTTADVDRAVEAAQRAYEGWRLFPAPKRGEILYRAAEVMLRRKDELAREMTREMGKVLAEARGDVQEGIDMTYYIAGEGLVLGSGSDLGDHLVTHPGVALISFTGSSETGAHISELAGRLLKRVSCELGGKNAIVVLDDANVDLAIDGIVWSAFGTSGQRCTAASRVIGQRGIANELIDRLVGRAKKLRLGHGLEDTTDVGPVVSKSQLDRVHSYIPVAEKEGATVAAGGRISREGALAKGWFHEPTVLVDVKPNMRVAQEEIFGPVTAVIETSSIDEAIKILNSTKYGLSCSVYTQNVNNAFRFMRDAECGIVYVNAGTIGAEIQLPFGGMKATGNGHREAGRAALDVYSEWKSIYVDYSGRLQKAQIDVVEKTGMAP